MLNELSPRLTSFFAFPVALANGSYALELYAERVTSAALSYSVPENRSCSLDTTSDFALLCFSS